MAVLMALSVWEIEFSRYARFYTAFQAAFLASLIFFYRGFVLGAARDRRWYTAAAALAISLHDLGLAVAVPFGVLWFSPRFTGRQKRGFVAWGAGIGLLWAASRVGTMLLKRWGDAIRAAEGLPAVIGIAGEQRSAAELLLPDGAAMHAAAQAHPWILAALVLLGAGACAWLVCRRSAALPMGRVGWGIAMMWAAVAHQFALVLLLGAGYLAWYWAGARTLRDLPLRTAAGVAAVSAAFWGWSLAVSPALAARRLELLLGYPRLYDYFLTWFLRGWPVMTVVLAVGCWRLIRWWRREPQAIAPLFAAGALVVPLLLFSIPQARSYQARYVFHLYPSVLLIVSWLAVDVGARLVQHLPVRALRAGGAAPRGLATAALAAAGLVLSQDANPAAAWAVGSRTYQSRRDPIRGVLNAGYYGEFHQDHEGPSLYVRAHRAPGDQVIALGPPHKLVVYHFYAGGVEYSLQEDVKWYEPRLADGTVIDKVTGRVILQSLPELRTIVEGGTGGLWLVGDDLALRPGFQYLYSEPMKAYLRRWAAAPDIVGADGQTFAVRIR
jgi:hypothetical protein